MEPLIHNLGDTFRADITLSKNGKPFDLTGQTLIALVKKEGKSDDDALDVVIIENHTDEKNGKTQIKMNGLDKKGEYTLYIKSVDGEDTYTLKELPITIK